MDELIEAVKIKAEADRLANIGKPDDKLASELEAQVE